jgi:hypothetical protein
VSDVAELRELARQVRELATRSRAAAGELRRAQGVRFVSDPAERYRDHLRDLAGLADGAAGELDDAAAARASSPSRTPTCRGG